MSHVLISRIMALFLVTMGFIGLLKGDMPFFLGGQQIELPKIFVRIFGMGLMVFAFYLFKHPEILLNFSRGGAH